MGGTGTGTPAAAADTTTALELKTEVETLTGSNSDTLKFLNRAQLLLALESRLRKTQYVAVTAGQITIPSDVLVVKAVVYDDTELYRFTTSYTDKMAISTSTTNTPDSWQILEGKIQLNTSVTCTLASATCEIIYIPRPATMTTADTPELDDCDEALIAFARWQDYVEMENPEKAAFWQNEWLEKKADWIELDWEANEEPNLIPRAVW